MEEKLRDKLFNKKEIGWKEIDERKKEEIFNFCNGYMKFLNKAKIEREFVVEAKKVAEEGDKVTASLEFTLFNSSNNLYCPSASKASLKEQ